MNEIILKRIRESCRELIQESDISGKYPEKAAAAVIGGGILNRYVGGDALFYSDVLISALTPFELKDFDTIAERILNLKIENVSNCFLIEGPHMCDNTASTAKYEMTVRFVYYTATVG